MHLHLGVFLSHCAISYNLSSWGSSAVGNKGKCWKICGSRLWKIWKEIDRTSPLDQGSHRLCCICQQRQWSLAWQLLPGLLPSLGVVQILQLYSINPYANISTMSIPFSIDRMILPLLSSCWTDVRNLGWHQSPAIDQSVKCHEMGVWDTLYHIPPNDPKWLL